MPAVLFDTLRLSRTLREKGHFTAEQAETLAEAFGEAAHEDLATKADVAALRSELKSEIANLRAELKTDIAEVKAEIAGVKAEILKWMVGAIGFQTAAILATIVGLVRIFAK